MIRYVLVSLGLSACASPSEPSTATTQPANDSAVQQPTRIHAKNFGDAVSTFTGLELNPHQSTLLKKVYQKRDEQKIIGITPVLILRYNFYQSKFCGVDIETTLEVLPTLVSLYGPATQADSVRHQYWWIGQTATATLQKTPGAAPWLSIWNNQLRTQLDAAEKAAAERQGQAASADL
jgi:hypothetical protein